MNSKKIFYSQEYNQSTTINKDCGLDDYGCQNQQTSYTLHSNWPCYYRMDSKEIVLQVPQPDRLIGLWYFLISFTAFCFLSSLIWLLYEIYKSLPFQQPNPLEEEEEEEEEQPTPKKVCTTVNPPAFNPNQDVITMDDFTPSAPPSSEIRE
jgi:hypothetical protein